jgi:hypothetical protein
VRIDGSSYTFLVDTGGGRTLITPAAAATLGCRPYGRDVGYRMNGEAVSFQNCERLDASIGAFTFHMAPVAVFDVAALLPAELPPLHGVLSLDAFRGHVVTIDWAGSTATIHSAADQTAALRAHGVPLRVATGENGASLTALLPVRAAHGGHLWFLLDSGNIRGTLVGRHVRQEAALPFTSDSAATLQIGTMPPALYEVVVDDINYDGVLGTAFLMAHVVTLDLRQLP